MKDLKEIKKEIKKSWLQNFTELRAYNQSSFYKIVGCSIIGFELIRSNFSEQYRPYFVCYHLGEKNVENVISGPQILKPLVSDNNSGNLLNIPYKEHSKYMNIVVDLINKQIPINLNGDVKANCFFTLIDIEANQQGIAIFEELNTYILQFHISLYLDDSLLITESLNNMENMTRKYPIEWFDKAFSAKYGNFSNWFMKIKNKIKNRDKFLEQIEKNKQDPKLKKLLVSEIMI